MRQQVGCASCVSSLCRFETELLFGILKFKFEKKTFLVVTSSRASMHLCRTTYHLVLVCRIAGAERTYPSAAWSGNKSLFVPQQNKHRKSATRAMAPIDIYPAIVHENDLSPDHGGSEVDELCDDIEKATTGWGVSSARWSSSAPTPVSVPHVVVLVSFDFHNTRPTNRSALMLWPHRTPRLARTLDTATKNCTTLNSRN